MDDTNDREKAVAEIGLRRRADADRRSVRREQVELGAIRMGRVDDGGALAEATRVGEQLDRPAPVLGETFLDLARLLAGVHVQREPLAVRVPAELLQPVERAGTHGVGGDTDPDAVRRECLDLREVGGYRRLAHAVEPAACIGDVEAGRSAIPASLRRPLRASASAAPR